MEEEIVGGAEKGLGLPPYLETPQQKSGPPERGRQVGVQHRVAVSAEHPSPPAEEAARLGVRRGPTGAGFIRRRPPPPPPPNDDAIEEPAPHEGPSQSAARVPQNSEVAAAAVVVVVVVVAVVVVVVGSSCLLDSILETFRGFVSGAFQSRPMLKEGLLLQSHCFVVGANLRQCPTASSTTSDAPSFLRQISPPPLLLLLLLPPAAETALRAEARCQPLAPTDADAAPQKEHANESRNGALLGPSMAERFAEGHAVAAAATSSAAVLFRIVAVAVDPNPAAPRRPDRRRGP